MRFVLNERKAAQAAATLLKAHCRPMSKAVLVKLLYLADRRSLKETGHPITGDCAVSMPYGPVLSTILDAINDKPVNVSFRAAWSDFVSPATGRKVGLKKTAAEIDELSRFDLRVLAEVYAEFGRRSLKALVDYTHDLPEWQDPEGSSRRIDPAVILRSEGWDEEAIDAASAEEEASIWFDRALARA